jgi:hypothetical protein
MPEIFESCTARFSCLETWISSATPEIATAASPSMLRCTVEAWHVTSTTHATMKSQNTCRMMNSTDSARITKSQLGYNTVKNKVEKYHFNMIYGKILQMRRFRYNTSSHGRRKVTP